MQPEIGHNSAEVDASRLKDIADRLIEAERNRQEAAEDVRELYKEARSDGFDIGALKEVVTQYFREEAKRQKAREKHEMALFYAERLGQLSLFE